MDKQTAVLFATEGHKGTGEGARGFVFLYYLAKPFKCLEKELPTKKINPLFPKTACFIL